MKRKPIDPRAVNDMDLSIAHRIRAFRVKKDIGQVTLAESIGVTFQQVQKYETGKNRISASRLYLIAGALDVPIEQFFGE